MALIRGFASVVLDRADCDGRLELDGHGHGHTWRFVGKDENPYARNVALSPDWQYQIPQDSETFLGETEYLACLRGAAPRGKAVRADMSLDDWAQELGTWQEILGGGYPAARYLWCPGAADTAAQVASNNACPAANVALWLYRWNAPYGAANAAYTVIGLLPETGDYWWAYYLPLQGQESQAKYPRLLRAPRGVPFDLRYHSVDECQGSLAGATSAADAMAADYIAIENTAGHLLMYWNGAADPWVYYDTTVGDLGSCRVRLEAYGHPVSFNCQRVQYPTTAYCRPYAVYTTPTYAVADHEYYYLGEVPTGTTIAITSDTGANPSPLQTDRPRVGFTSDGARRPVCYNVTQIHYPTFTEAVSEAVDLSAEKVVRSISGQVTDSWRGATCDVVLRTTPDQFTIKQNQKVTVDVNWLRTDTSLAAVRQFTGYVTRVVPVEDPNDLGHRQITVHCEDGFTARLQGRKKMLNHACYAGMAVRSVLRHILLRCGVPEALIDLSAVPNVLLPTATREGDLLFDFTAEEEATAALDLITQAIGMTWGVNASGMYRPFYRETYSGTPDTTISDTATAEGDLLYALEAERGYEDFRNYVAFITGAYPYTAAALVRDEDSHDRVAYADFIGDDWWQVETIPDGDNPTLMALTRWKELFKRRQVVKWETSGKVDLWPGQFVQVTASGLDVAAGTVVRLVEKSWAISQDDGDYTCSFLGVKEQ